MNKATSKHLKDNVNTAQSTSKAVNLKSITVTIIITFDTCSDGLETKKKRWYLNSFLHSIVQTIEQKVFTIRFTGLVFPTELRKSI